MQQLVTALFGIREGNLWKYQSTFCINNKSTSKHGMFLLFVKHKFIFQNNLLHCVKCHFVFVIFRSFVRMDLVESYLNSTENSNEDRRIFLKLCCRASYMVQMNSVLWLQTLQTCCTRLSIPQNFLVTKLSHNIGCTRQW